VQKVTMAAGGFFIIIIGILIGHFAIPPPDGNPVGFHLHGLAKMDQQSLNLSSCSNSTPCYVQIDLAFDPSAAPSPTPTPCATSTSCISFSNTPTTPIGASNIWLDYTGYSTGHFADYVIGVIQGAPPSPAPGSPSPRPTTPR